MLEGKMTLDPLDPVQLTRRLVDIESTTYDEGAVGAFLADFLTARGFKVETTPVPHSPGHPATAERLNVYAAAQSAPPDIVFSTHMDTVPPYIPSSEDEDYIHGRGSCDAKGIIAAQIAAAEQLRAQGIRVALLFVVGEERDSAGAKIANLNPKGSRFLINGEPTDNRLALASKGALRVLVEAHGKMAHSAYPELGDSATAKLVHALERVLAVELPTEPGIGPSTLNLGLISGGHAPNVIADYASAQLLVRLVGDAESTKAAILAAVAPYAQAEFTLEIPFVRLREVRLREAPGSSELPALPTMIAAFTTDIPALSAWGEPLLLGPGSIHVAHTPHERLAKRELFEAIDLYVRVALQLVDDPAVPTHLSADVPTRSDEGSVISAGASPNLAVAADATSGRGSDKPQPTAQTGA
jgi:acetylornithine deacetylase